MNDTSRQCEMGLLGCVLHDTSTVDHIVKACRKPELLFDDLRHRDIWNYISKQHEEGAALDPITISIDLEPVAIRDYFSLEFTNMMDAAPVAGNWQFHLNKLRPLAEERLIKQLSTLTSAHEAESHIANIQADLSPSEAKSVKDIINSIIDEIEEAAANPGDIRGLESGITPLDYATRGFRPGQLIVIGARPGVGKTALALNIAEHIAIKRQLSVGFISLEMPENELLKRPISTISEVPLGIIESGRIPEIDFPKVIRATSSISSSPIEVATGCAPLREIISTIRLMAKNGAQLVVVDYLQLILTEDQGSFERVTKASMALKSLALECKIPVIAISQLNRSGEASQGEGSRPPTMSDLKQSGQIEQDADIIILLHRKDWHTGETAAYVPKNRQGKPGLILKSTFQGEIFKFNNWEIAT